MKILVGILILVFFIFIGVPFELENPLIDSIFRTVAFSLIFLLLTYLFFQTKLLTSLISRALSYLSLGILTLLFCIGTIWNDIIRTSNHRNWQTMEICTNAAGNVIYRQVRETSGSIFDYRDRLLIYEFNYGNRITVNTKMNYYTGPWTVHDLHHKRIYNIPEIE